MATITKKYYESCPNCGGHSENDNPFCSFCGASLIRSEKIEFNKREDLFADDTPVDIVSNAIPSASFLPIFFMGFGAFFAVFPLSVGIIISIATGDLIGLLFVMIFLLIGLGFFIPGVILFNKGRKITKLGKTYDATVLGYSESMVMMNNRPILNIKVRAYMDGIGKCVQLNTNSTDAKWAIGSTIKIIGYGNSFLIKK